MKDPSKADFKYCVPTAADSKGFDCIKSTNAPTPNPTPPPPTLPTASPTDDPTGDVCRDEVGCKSTDIGRLKGCICNPSGKCTGTDAESGLVLGCNRATNRCGPCNPGTLFCACLNGNACSAAGLVCDDGQCMPTAGGGFSLPCPIKGGIGCPCLTEKCSPKYACSSQLSRCISCPPGCKEKCSQAAIGINDTCAGLSTSCMECKANPDCAWCGESGCRSNTCPDGGLGAMTCASCRGVSECNGGGECIGPDTCKCRSGFIDDAALGCRPPAPRAPCTECTTSNSKGGQVEFCLCVRDHIRCLNGTFGSLSAKCDAGNVLDGTYAAVCPELCASLSTVTAASEDTNPQNDSPSLTFGRVGLFSLSALAILIRF